MLASLGLGRDGAKAVALRVTHPNSDQKPKRRLRTCFLPRAARVSLSLEKVCLSLDMVVLLAPGHEIALGSCVGQHG